MSKRTKTVGPTGRFGPRYGVRDRVRFRDVEVREKGPHTCPDCGRPTVSRRAAGIWSCRKCGLVMTGGAYYPRTDSGVVVEKSIQGVLEKLEGGKEA